jgi:hypothetical protein
MQATTMPTPQLGEWYSRQELFDAYPGHWALLAFPNELSPEEGWDIMYTRGVLIEMDQNHDKVWQAYRRYKAEQPHTPTYFLRPSNTM